MSRISELGGRSLSNLVSVIAEYEIDTELVQSQLSVEGKTAKQAQQDQIEYPFQYDKKRIELRSIAHYVEQQVNAVKGKLFQESVENYTFEISDRARMMYVEGHSQYLEMQELYLEIDELYQTYCAIVDAWKARGFALKDHTAIIINGLQERVF